MANRENDIQKIKVNGVELACRFDGPEDGRVVMMSNSLMSDHTMWDITVPALADRYRVLRYDTRGHGRSGTTPGPYSIEMLADDAIGLIDATRHPTGAFCRPVDGRHDRPADRRALPGAGLLAFAVRYGERDAAALDMGGALRDRADTGHCRTGRLDDPALVHRSVHRARSAVGGKGAPDDL